MNTLILDDVEIKLAILEYVCSRYKLINIKNIREKDGVKFLNAVIEFETVPLRKEQVQKE